MDKRIIALISIIAILCAGIGFAAFYHETPEADVNKTVTNNTTVKNATLQSESHSASSESGQYGYCAICGKALTYAEAHSEYTQGKVCHSCASNPYYQTEEGAEYANQKLYEAYPDDYDWMYDDTSGDDYDYEYDDYEDYDDYEYDEDY